MTSMMMTQMKVATIDPHMAACMIQFHLITSIAKCKLTLITTAIVQMSPRLEASMSDFQYAKRGRKKIAPLCHNVSAIVSQKSLELQNSSLCPASYSLGNLRRVLRPKSLSRIATTTVGTELYRTEYRTLLHSVIAVVKVNPLKSVYLYKKEKHGRGFVVRSYYKAITYFDSNQ